MSATSSSMAVLRVGSDVSVRADLSDEKELSKEKPAASISSAAIPKSSQRLSSTDDTFKTVSLGDISKVKEYLRAHRDEIGLPPVGSKYGTTYIFTFHEQDDGSFKVVAGNRYWQRDKYNQLPLTAAKFQDILKKV